MLRMLCCKRTVVSTADAQQLRATGLHVYHKMYLIRVIYGCQYAGRMYARTCACVRIHTYVHTYIHTYMRTYRHILYIYICNYTFLYVSLLARVYEHASAPVTARVHTRSIYLSTYLPVATYLSHPTIFSSWA